MQIKSGGVRIILFLPFPNYTFCYWYTDSAMSEGTSEPIAKEKSSTETLLVSETLTGSDLASKASSVPESPINSIEVPGTSKVVEDLG